MKRWIALLAVLVLLPPMARAGGWIVDGGDARHGKALVQAMGCARCHTIPSVPHADGNVGPPLTRFADRTFIAGMLRNEPSNLQQWLRHPQQVVPGNAMPDMGIDEQQARDIAAFLYTLH